MTISGFSFGQGRGVSGADSLSGQVVVRHIYLEGNKTTRTRIILREMSIREGEIIESGGLYNLMRTNEQRIFNLPIFTDVAITTQRITRDTVDWIVKVKERWYIMPEVTFKLADRNLNVWWEEQNHDIRRANIGLILKHQNFRGNLEAASVGAQIGYTQKFSLNYDRPYIDRDQLHGIGANFNLSRNQEIYYITDSNKLLFIKDPQDYIIKQLDVALTYTYRPAYASRHQFEARYKDFEIANSIVRLNPEYFERNSRTLRMLELIYRFSLNRVDNWNYPLTGFKTVTYGTTRIGFQGVRFQQAIQTELARFYNPYAKVFLSEIFRGRLTFPEDQPYFLRNALGTNSEYVRGYEYYVIDGSQYAVFRTNFKYELLNIKIRKIPFRYLPVIPIRIYPKVYADAGYTVNRYPGNSFLNNRWLYSAGAGLDFVSAYDVKLRVEYTFNHLGQKGLFLHLNSE